MLRVRNIKIKYNKDNQKQLIKTLANKLQINPSYIRGYRINKKSFDARKKENLHYVYEIDVDVLHENKIIKTNDIFQTPIEEYKFQITGTEIMTDRPIVVGSGPAGLFAAYILAENGFKPIIIERGEKIEDRTKTVEKFWLTGQLNTESNVQFGEGGAGTFSDGKLNTLVKDKNFRMKKVFETFVENGAPNEILYINKPHIGTDILSNVVKNIRNKIIQMGGEIKYNTKLTNLIIQDNQLKAIEINNNEIITCSNLVLAIGHSARDTFEMLYNHKLEMEAKPFAVGVRIQHPQKMINQNQYGIEDLTADYKLTTNINGRGVYSFCMCPGGYVVNASSEQERLAINGMSYHARNSENANSAIIVTVSPNDFGNHPLDGIKFQRALEEKAYQSTNGKIPIQLFKDFNENKMSLSFKNTNPVFKGEYKFANLNEILPTYVSNSLKEAIKYFDKKIKGYASDDAILAAVESRTSSPVKIIRDENLVSNIKGIYPCGEGAGYAGGITTSAMDGIKVAEAIMSIYQK